MISWTQPVVGRRLGRWGGAARCVYCGRRCAAFHFACWQHRDLTTVDPFYVTPGDRSVESVDEAARLTEKGPRT